MTQREEFEKIFSVYNLGRSNSDSEKYSDRILQRMWEAYTEGWKAAKAQAVPQWISVEDQLPNHDAGKWSNPVIALSDIGLVFRLSYCGGWQRTGDFMSTGSSKVTHWMPLPAAPEQPK